MRIPFINAPLLARRVATVKASAGKLGRRAVNGG
jgi:hypothetical protein